MVLLLERKSPENFLYLKISILYRKFLRFSIQILELFTPEAYSYVYKQHFLDLLRAHNTKSKMCYNVKSPIYYFYVKTNFRIQTYSKADSWLPH